MVDKKHIALEKATLSLIEEYIVLLKFKDKVDVELKDAVEVDEKIFDLVDGKPFVVLIDARNISSNMSHEARDFFATDKKVLKIRKAQAIIVNNLQSRLIAKFYITFHKPVNPIKIFNDYEEAYQWVKKEKKKWYQ